MKIFIPVFVLLFSNIIHSQSGIESSYNAVYNGRNFNLSFRKTINTISISGGIKYHINRIEFVPIGSFFKNSAYAINLGEHFGLQFCFDYLPIIKQNFKLGLFYNNQISYISELHKMYYAHGQLVPNPQSELDYVYTKSEKIFGPIFQIDNTLGVVIQTNITNQFYLVLRGGFGMMFWKNTDPNVILLSNLNQRGLLFTSFGSIGLGYNFKKK